MEWPRMPEGYVVRYEPQWGWLLYRKRGEGLERIGGPHEFRLLAILAVP